MSNIKIIYTQTYFYTHIMYSKEIYYWQLLSYHRSILICEYNFIKKLFFLLSSLIIIFFLSILSSLIIIFLNILLYFYIFSILLKNFITKELLKINDTENIHFRDFRRYIIFMLYISWQILSFPKCYGSKFYT